jgi:uncharacterized phage-associated protein
VSHCYGVGKECAVEYDERKFAEMLLYVAARLEDDPAGGATKLNKALYFAELVHMRLNGRPITGAEYQKLPQGPAPRRLVPVRQALLDKGDAEMQSHTYFGRLQKRLVPLRQADLSVFSGDEIAAIDEVVNDLNGRSASEVSDMSHREMGWWLAEENETIEWEMAYLKPAVLTPEVRAYARRLAGERGLS